MGVFTQIEPTYDYQFDFSAKFPMESVFAVIERAGYPCLTVATSFGKIVIVVNDKDTGKKLAELFCFADDSYPSLPTTRCLFFLVHTKFLDLLPLWDDILTKEATAAALVSETERREAERRKLPFWERALIFGRRKAS